MKKQALKKKKKESPKASTEPQNEEIKDPFDFGGLPKRNLKKNLGCG